MKHLLVVFPLALGACVQQDSAPAAATVTAAQKPAEAAPAAGAAYAQAGHDCGGGNAPVQFPDATTAVQNGVNVTTVGQKLSGAPVVTVADLLQKPEAYAGKTVRLEGNVSAMCSHKRAWFAVQSDDKSGSYVRVMTAPVFLVPENSIGHKAITEGMVEVIQDAPEHTAHLEKEHKLGAEGVPAAAKKIVVRAIGAEFI